MAKKAELLEKAAELGLELTDKNTIAEIEAALETAGVKEEKATAKAGKRSEKAQAEAEAKIEKEARKEAGDTTPLDEEAEAATKKGPKPVTRPRIERRGKGYQKVAQLVQRAQSLHLNYRRL